MIHVILDKNDDFKTSKFSGSRGNTFKKEETRKLLGCDDLEHSERLANQNIYTYTQTSADMYICVYGWMDGNKANENPCGDAGKLLFY